MSESKELQITVQGGHLPATQEAQTLARLNTVRSVLAPDLTDQELQLFAMVAVRSGLDPFAKQIYAVKRPSRQGPRMTIQTGIDGYRSIAARTGEYDGQDEPTYTGPCPCGGTHPESATVAVYRKGMSRPVKATAFWHEYVPEQAFMWQKMPHVMIAKVAEALALRKAFPWDPTRGVGIGSDVYTAEEMAQAETSTPAPSLEARLEARRADEEGISVRDFRDAAASAGLDPNTIVAVRDEMFPNGGNVADLSPLARKALLDRLLEGAADESSPDPEEAPGASEEPGEILDDAQVIEGEPEPPGEVQIVACEDPSPFTEGAVCLLPKRHRGAHRSSPAEAWDRAG